jgi:hypothetical protein
MPNNEVYELSLQFYYSITGEIYERSQDAQTDPICELSTLLRLPGDELDIRTLYRSSTCRAIFPHQGVIAVPSRGMLEYIHLPSL